MKKLNVAIIGQGRSGRLIHGAYFLSEAGKERYNVVAVVDRDEKRRKVAAEMYGCDVYENHTGLYDRKDLDFVVVSTFSNERFPVVMDLLNHKINVIAEKPFGRCAMECERMVKAAKDNGVMLTAFQQSRLMPYFQNVKEVIESGVLGNIQHIVVNFSGYGRRWDWQCSQRMYGGELMNTGPHPLDQVLDLLGTDDMPNVFSVLKRVNTAGDGDDFVKIMLTYPGKPLIEIEISKCDAYSDYVYRVCGDRGTLRSTTDEARWKYFEEKPMPELVLGAMTEEDGVTPAYCSEQLVWHEFSKKFEGDTCEIGTKNYYENIYNHFVNGEDLFIRIEKIIQQIRIIELVHAQNPLDVKY